MSTDAAQSAAELNAASASARIAQESAQNAGQSAPKTETAKTATVRTSRSAAMRKANATANTPAAKSPKYPKQPVAAKVTKIAKKPEPSPRSSKQSLGTALIANAAKFAASYRMPKDCPMTREEIVAQALTWSVYVPAPFPEGVPVLSGSFGGRRNKSA